jgi:beta-lactamase superfamily II metal-dependent hydrolase
MRAGGSLPALHKPRLDEKENSMLRPALASLLLLATTATAQDVGDVLPPWTPGTLDIHQISTGRGNCAFFVLPDGTTMVVDAGELSGSTPRHAPPRPDDSRPAGEWLTRYIRHVAPSTDPPRIDYAVLTHFHGDHMGSVSDDSKVSSSGAYRLTGITQIGDEIPIRKMLDHGWPDYAYPSPHDNRNVRNYRAFLEWQQEHGGLVPERFEPGRNDQIVLNHEPDAYSNFEVRNIMANGEIWTGVGTTTRRHFSPLGEANTVRPTENMSSLGFRLSYGAFDYFTGGDIPGIALEGQPGWFDVETPVAQAVGPMDVSLLNHHGYMDSMNAYFVGALRPRVWILPVWDSAHPTHRAYYRLQSRFLYPGPRDVFATNMHPANRLVVVGLDRLASDRGHIVVRVEPAGGRYRVLILDDSAETYEVTAVHGPYESR